MSYRRSDAAGHARALHRELSRRFDAGFAFLDRAGIEVGDEFPERLRAAVESCLVMLVLVGPGWLEAEAADGARRLDDPADFVRAEVSLALAAGKVVIPVLLDDAPMPPAGRLPDALRALARCDAFVLRGKDYEYERQLEDLVKQLARRTGVAPQRDNVGLAIDLGDAVALYRHIEYLPVRLRAPLREAFRPLIEDRQRFFGGRREVIDRLMAFVGGPDPGYCVVSAPAGFGKTALAANLVAGAGDAIAYHFFTPLYGEATLSEIFFLRSVLEQMAAWHDEAWDVPSTLDGLRAAYQQAVGKPLAGRGVLLLDGIDEVRGWTLAPYVSRALPSGVHVIATVRDVGQDWRAQFGFPASQLTHMTLDGLDRGGVGAVLATVEGPGAALVRGGRVSDAVFGLAGGDEREARLADPFYVRFLAEDLAAGHLTAETLASAPRGLQAYLDQWWGEIRALAGEQPVRDLFGTLAVAAGPLRREELEAVQPSLVDEWHADRFDEVVGRVRRFVVRDPGGGYSLVHPRLREFVQGRIRVEPYRARLLAYCRDWRSGHRYALAYVGLHLAEAGDWPALLGLVATEAGGRAFLDLRRDAEGSHAGFLRDLERVWSHSEERAPTDPRSLADVVRCALVASSIRTMAGTLAPALLEAAVRHDIWPVLVAIEHATENPDPVQRSQALGTLLPRMSEAQRRRACEAALAAAKAMRPDVRRPPVLVLEGPAPPIRDLDRRGDVLAPLATVVPDELRDDALAIVRSLDRPDQIPVLIAALATGVPPPGRAVLVEEALAAVDRVRPRSRIYSPFTVPPGVRQARALVAMSAHLEEPRRGDVCRMAVDRAGHAPRDRGIRALVELLPKLPPAAAAQAIERILARLDEGGASRLEHLSAIVAHPAAGPRRDAIVAEIRSRLQEEDDAEAVAEGLLGILPFLPEGERAASRDLLLQRAASIEDADARGRILARVAEQAEPAWRQRALDAAVEAIAQMNDEEAWVEAVVRLVPLVDDALHRQILAAASIVEDAEERARVLGAIASFAGREVIVEALAHGRIIGDDQGNALPESDASDVQWKEDVDASDEEDDIPDFYAVARPGTLAEARAIAFDLERVAGLVLVARSRPDVERVGVLDEAFAEAVRINGRERRHRALCIVGRALAGASRERLSALCVHALRTGASRARAELASDLAALRPLVEQVDRGAAAAVGAIVDEIVQWLP
ncbi:MAG: TIR domain-containing protein [Candidatus Rokuibacteriota bacterium]